MRKRMLSCHDLLLWRSALNGPFSGALWEQSYCRCPAGKEPLLELQRDKKISFKQTPNTSTFQEVQLSTGTLWLLLILHNPSCILPFKENTFLIGLAAHWQRKEKSPVFLLLCHHIDKMNCPTAIAQKNIKHSAPCAEIYVFPSLSLLGICGSMVIYFK